MKKKKKFEDFKREWKEFWEDFKTNEEAKKTVKEIGTFWLLSCLIGAIAGTKSRLDRYEKRIKKLENPESNRAVNENSERDYKIDEEIFTDLAPQLENLVCDDGIETAHIDTSFEIGQNVNKRVTIDVETIYGD